jgi:hypothetical protein
MPKRKAAADAPLLSLAKLDEMRKTSKKQFRNAQNTDEKYLGYITQGKKFLEALVEGQQNSCRAHLDECVDEAGNQRAAEEADFEIKEMARALDDPPNKYSAMIVESYIIQKCITEGLGKSTAEGIQSAFIQYWSEM